MKKNERRRLITQAISFAFSNGYAHGFTARSRGGHLYAGALKNICLPGLNCYSCPGAVGACPIGALQAVLGSGTFRVSLYVFGFIGLMGMLFGRLICGWVCPFGLVQELLYKIPLRKKRKNMPGHRKLLKLKYILLALLLLVPMLETVLKGSGSPAFCAWICPAGTLLGGIPQLILDPGLRSAAGLRFIVKLVLLLAVLVLSVLVYRPFCKYMCPLGALYSLANPVSVYRYVIDTDKCVKCGACQAVCGMDIKVWEDPNARECIRCGRCKAACKQKAIRSSKEIWEERITARHEETEEKKEKKVFIKKINMILILLAAFLLGAGLMFAVLKLPREKAQTAAPEATAASGTLIILCRTEDGALVEGVTAQVCSGRLCHMLTSDGNGIMEYEGMPGAAPEITPVRAPEGYAFVSDAPFTVNGRNTEIVLRKS